MKNKMKIFVLIIGVFFILFTLHHSETFGNTISQVQDNLQNGTIDANLDAISSPGNIILKEDYKNSYSGYDSFKLGSIQHLPSTPTKVGSSGDQSIGLSDYYFYSKDTSPALPDDGYGSNVTKSWFDPDTGLLYVSVSGKGLSVFDTKGTQNPSDDNLLITYSTTSSPSIGCNGVQSFFLDKSTNLLYIDADNGFYSGTGGVFVVDTQGTKDVSDDTLFTSYTTTSTPSIGSSRVYDSFLNSSSGYLYIGTWSGIYVIDTHQTKVASDDTGLTTYTTSTSPSIGFNNVQKLVFDSTNNLLYVVAQNGNNGGFSVINFTNNHSYKYISTGVYDITANSTGTLLSSNPALPCNTQQDVTFDTQNGLVYVASYNSTIGLSVIDTKKTVDPSDDTIIQTFGKNTSIPIPNSNINANAYSVAYDSTHHILVIGAIGAKKTGFYYDARISSLMFIDTKGNSDPQDDELIKTYSSGGSTPEINKTIPMNDPYVSDLYYCQTNGTIYAGFWGSGEMVIPIGAYNKNGSYISQPFQFSSNPVNYIKWAEDKTSNQDVTMQTRTGGTNACWIDDFNDGNVSNIGDIANYGVLMSHISENGGILTLSGPDPNPGSWGGWTYFDVNFGGISFPANSIIKVKLKINTNATGFDGSIYTGTNDSTGNFSFTDTNQWIYSYSKPSQTATTKVGFEFYWDKGTWDANNDSIQVDWISVEAPDTNWGTWSSECKDNSNCLIQEKSGKTCFQYKLNLTSNNQAATPKVNSIIVSSGYHQNGTYISSVLDSGGDSHWRNFTPDSNIPSDTDIEYSTRSGNTPVPDSSWSDWSLTNSPIFSPDSRYIQYKAVFSTDNISRTPSLSSATITYAPNSSNTTVNNTSSTSTTYQIPAVATSPRKQVVLNDGILNITSASNLVFRGRLASLIGGRVRIYREGKYVGLTKIKRGGKWRKRIRSMRKKHIFSYYFQYFNSNGELVETTPSFRVRIK